MMGKGASESKMRPCMLLATLLVTSTFVLVFNTVREQNLQNLLQHTVNFPLEVPLGEEYLETLPARFRRPQNWNNLLVQYPYSYTDTLINLLALNSTNTSSCYRDETSYTKLEGLPKPVNGKFLFRTDELHRLTLVAFGADGQRRCGGGDYYEVDFHDQDNLRYRSRLPTVDFGNGSYGLELTVPSRFAGVFTVEIWLLFTNWHGLDPKTEQWAKMASILTQENLEMFVDEEFSQSLESVGDGESNLRATGGPVKDLTKCTQADFERTTWQGRWTRSWYNDKCQPDGQKRFRCLPEEHYACEEPWCYGPVGRLESNGWEYSAHCGFKIFEREEAWDCLNGKWILVWGDSNFQDTMRNLLLFILEWQYPAGKNLANFQLERSYEQSFVNPRNKDQGFRVSSHFNGADPPWLYGVGLNTLKYEMHQEKIYARFNGSSSPDMVFMNSGLHDGVEFDNMEDYSASADYAIDWWAKLYESVPEDRKPQLVWRSTIAPAGPSRKMGANPNKMEMLNLVMAEKLQRAREKLPVKFIDGLDLTFPFHYNTEFSDGGHYGRAPGTRLRPWYGKPHWYFVDIMLGHMFLNSVCPST